MNTQEPMQTLNGIWNRHILNVTERMYKISFKAVWDALLRLPRDQRPDPAYVKAYLQRNYPER